MKLRWWGVGTQIGTTLALSCLLALSLWSGGSRAQDLLPTPRGQLGGAPSLDTTPSAPEPEPTREEGEPDIPSPEECDVAPRTIEEMQALAAATPVAAVATPLAAVAGEPSGEEVVAEITATVRTLVACANAGDGPRLLALLAEAYVARLVEMAGPEAVLAIVAISPAQPPLTMPEIRDVRRVDGDHVVARLQPTSEQAILPLTPPGTLDVLFRHDGERWVLLDLAPAESR